MRTPGFSELHNNFLELINALGANSLQILYNLGLIRVGFDEVGPQRTACKKT
jgi:hypothetical protein